MLIELKQRAISAVRGPVRGKRYDIALGNPRHFFDCHVFARHLGANRCREYLGIPRVCLCMQPERAMSLFRRTFGSGEKQRSEEHTSELKSPMYHVCSII